jgi:hypothetical protein
MWDWECSATSAEKVISLLIFWWRQNTLPIAHSTIVQQFVHCCSALLALSNYYSKVFV